MHQLGLYAGLMERTDSAQKNWIKTPISVDARRVLNAALKDHGCRQRPLLERLLLWFGRQTVEEQRVILSGLTEAEFESEAERIKRRRVALALLGQTQAAGEELVRQAEAQPEPPAAPEPRVEKRLVHRRKAGR